MPLFYEMLRHIFISAGTMIKKGNKDYTINIIITLGDLKHLNIWCTFSKT
jgi:hypothetical protein